MVRLPPTEFKDAKPYKFRKFPILLMVKCLPIEVSEENPSISSSEGLLLIIRFFSILVSASRPDKDIKFAFPLMTKEKSSLIEDKASICINEALFSIVTSDVIFKFSIPYSRTKDGLLLMCKELTCFR